MPEFINGLPLHALVVHFVVVLLPLAVLGSILTAVWPAVRRRYGWLTVAVAAVAAALVPVATDSGESLERRVGENPAVERHAELGDLTLWWALPLFVVVAALMIFHTMGERRDGETRPDAEQEEPAGGGTAVLTATRKVAGVTVATVVAAVLTVGLAVGTGIHIYRVGDAGARAVWEGTANLPPAGHGG